MTVEVGESGETTIPNESIPGQAPNESAPPAEGATPNPEGSPAADDGRRDFVLDKYRAEGRTEQQSLEEQAKGYGELQSKFGSFTGAPETYEVSLSDEIVEKGIEINPEDPLLVRAMEFAKESNMSQEGFNSMVNLHVENALAEQQALENFAADEMKGLGSNAQVRLDSINSFIGANFDEETVAGIQGMATSAEGVKAVEALIARARGSSVAAEETDTPPGITAAEINAMQFEKDANGNRRINTDPAFKAEFKKKQSQLYGDSPYREQIG